MQKDQIAAGFARVVQAINTLSDNQGSAGGVPVGTIITRKGQTVPEGYLLCDGSVLQPGVYPELQPFLRLSNVLVGGTMIPNSEITATASSHIDTRHPQCAFDEYLEEYGPYGQSLGVWHSNYEYKAWLSAELSTPSVVNAYRVYGRGDGYNIESWTFSGSNDGVDWTLLDDASGAYTPNGGFIDRAIANPGSYKHYRIQSGVYMYTVIAELQLFVGVATETAYFLPDQNSQSWPPELPHRPSGASGWNTYIKY